MKNKLLLSALMMTALAGCSSTPEKPSEPTTTYINDYPTQDRIDYVFTCIAKHGGLTYINQYGCSCKLDKIAEKISFAEYDKARTYGFLRSTAGEAGGVFRDPKEAKALKKKIQEAEAYAEKMCFVK